MSLETLCVKIEAEVVSVKEEAEEYGNEETGAHVKAEVESEDSAGLCDLYAGHQIKEELVLGPEDLHRPCVLSTLPVAANRAERESRVGLHTYTLRRTRDPAHCTDTPSALYQCDECGEEFRNNSALRKHINTHSSGPSTCLNKSALPATLKRVKKARGRSCSLRRERRLVDAEQIHAGRKRFKCSVCDYQCHFKSRLQRHQSKHTEEKPFKCIHCDYKCRRNDELKIHERTHTREKPFNCSYCDYKCRRKDVLKSHEWIHTGKKPFKCSHCDYKYMWKYELKRHERIHTGEKPFKCSYCDYKCGRKDVLKSHERIHTGEKPFKCSYCDYKSRLKVKLQQHQMTHTGEKPFKCSYCEYKCIQKPNLKSHERIHTGENLLTVVTVIMSADRSQV